MKNFTLRQIAAPIAPGPFAVEPRCWRVGDGDAGDGARFRSRRALVSIRACWAASFADSPAHIVGAQAMARLR